MVGLHKVSKVVVLGSLLLAGTCVQAMEEEPRVNTGTLVKSEPFLPERPVTLTFILKQPCLTEYLDLDLDTPASEILRKTLNEINKELYAHRQALKTDFKYSHTRYKDGVGPKACDWLEGRKIKNLYLSGLEISDKVFCSLSELVSAQLKVEAQLTGEGWGQLSALRSLFLSSIACFKGENLTLLTGLTSLTVHQTNIGDGKYLEPLTGLTNLDLKEVRSQDGAFVKALTNLRSLDLLRIDIDGGKHLTALTSLTNLNARETAIHDIELQHLTNLSSLTLWPENGITGDAFGKLENLTSLSLNLDGPGNMTDYCFNMTDSCLSKLQNLKALTVCCDIEKNLSTNCTALKEIHFRTSITRPIGLILRVLPSLETIKQRGDILLQAEPGTILSQEQRNLIERFK